MFAEGDRVPVDALEDAARENHVVTGDRWQPVEGDDGLRPEAELLRAERDDLSAIHVALPHELGDVGEEPLRVRALRCHHLDTCAGARRPHVLVRPGNERDERHTVGLHEIEAKLHDGKDAIAVEVEIHPVDRALGQAEAVGRRPAVHKV